MGRIKEKLLDQEEKARSQSDPVDRIILKRDERDRLDAWLKHLNEHFDGMIKFSKSDLANFLIRKHDAVLAESELRELGTQNYDEMRWISRAIERVRRAKRNGEALTLEDLMAKRKLFKKVKAPVKKIKNQDREQVANNQHFDENQIELIEANSSER